MLEHYHRLNATISDLVMGNTYKFRVFAENKCGISPEAAVAKEEGRILKTGLTLMSSECVVLSICSNLCQFKMKLISVHSRHFGTVTK